MFIIATFVSGFIMKAFILYLPGYLTLDLNASDSDYESIAIEDDLFVLLKSSVGTSESIWIIDIVHWIHGVIFVGLAGCLHLIVSMVFGLGPFPRMGYFRIGNSSRRGNDKTGTLIVGIIICIGCLKACQTIYSWVKRLARSGLTAVEDSILEVKTDESLPLSHWSDQVLEYRALIGAL